MKVSIFFNGIYPGFGASVNRISNYVSGLKAQGASVKIVPCPSVYTGYVLARLERFLTPFKVLPLVLKERNRTDIIFSYGHSWQTIVVMKVCLLFSRTKIVLEVCEKPGTTYASWFYELYPVKLFNLLGTKFIEFKIADGFVVISHALENYVQLYKSRKASLIRIPILIDTRAYQKRGDSKWSTKKPYMLHTGLITDQKDGIINVIKAFVAVCKKRDGNLDFYFTIEKGPRADIATVKRIVAENGLEDYVHFLGELEMNELIDLQANCSMLVLNKPENEQNLHNFPTKLGEYLSLAKPVIASQVGEMLHYLVDDHNALLLPDNFPESIAMKIEYVLDNPAAMKSISANARELACREFDILPNGNKLFRYFQKLLHG